MSIPSRFRVVACRRQVIGADTAYLFQRTGETWVELEKLLPGEASGVGISAHGGLAVVTGAPGAVVFALPLSIPAVSTWGVVVMTLLLLVAGTITLDSPGTS